MSINTAPVARAISGVESLLPVLPVLISIVLDSLLSVDDADGDAEEDLSDLLESDSSLWTAVLRSEDSLG